MSHHDTPEWRRYARHFLDDVLPMMRESEAVVSIAPPDEGDVRTWLELGAAIMLGKPIIVVRLRGRVVPRKLAAVADEVVYLTSEEGTSEEQADLVAAAIRRALGRRDGPQR